jgi:hypothetical protein
VAIDIFSRFAYCEPIKTMKEGDVETAQERILSGSRKPNAVKTGRGIEFRG